MNRQIKSHEDYIQDALSNPSTNLDQLLTSHEKWIGFMQHERLIHLLVTLFLSIIFVVLFGISTISPSLYYLILLPIILVLLLFYILHYYRLENSVQRWYILYDEIKLKKEGHIKDE